jgi:putative membrane protein
MNKKTKVLILVLALILTLGFLIRMFVPMLFEQVDYGYYPHMFGHMGYGMGVYGMGFIWVIVIGIALYLFFNQNNNKSDELQILKNRLANGDINDEEYDRLKKKLER